MGTLPIVISLATGLLLGGGLSAALFLRSDEPQLPDPTLRELEAKLQRRDKEMLVLTAFLCHVVDDNPKVRPLLQSFEARLPDLTRRLLGMAPLPSRWDAAMSQYDGIRDRWKGPGHGAA